MRTRTMIRLVISAILMALAAGLAVAETELQPGTVVFGEWFENQWYRGTILEPCGGGYIVRAETGETKCVSLDKIVLDVVPEAKAVSRDAAVLAEWAPGQFYPGVVSSIEDGSYDIRYDDGDRSTVGLDGIRLQGNLDAEGATVVSATEQNTVESAMVILRQGSDWAEIRADGTVLVEGSPVGKITADGSVYHDGRAVGAVNSDGVITMDGRQVGEIAMDGRLWRGGSPVGSVIVNGELYLGGSKWGEADVSYVGYSEQRVLAAIVAFFAPDFGFVR
jgi:hypothetical protein